MRQTCDQLDDYLCGWLDAEEAAEFDEHLAGCETCRAALELQRRIDGNLSAYRKTIAIPESVTVLDVDSQSTPVSSRHRISAAAASVLAAAAVLIGLGVGLYLIGISREQPADIVTPDVSDRPDMPLVVTEPESSPDAADTAATVPVAIQTGPGSIALEMPARSSRVSVFRVYNVIGQSSDRD